MQKVKNNLTLISNYSLLLLQMLLINIYAQFTNSTKEIIISIDGRKVKLTIVKSASFCTSMMHYNIPSPISDIIIEKAKSPKVGFSFISKTPICVVLHLYKILSFYSSTKRLILYDTIKESLISNSVFTSTKAAHAINENRTLTTLYYTIISRLKKLIQLRSDIYLSKGVAVDSYF